MDATRAARRPHSFTGRSTDEDPRASRRTTTTRRPRSSSTACPSPPCRRSASRATRTTRRSRVARHRAVPRAAPASSPSELDAVVFYEKPMLKFERILTMALREWPRTLLELPAGDEEHARREALGEGPHQELARRPGRARSSSPSTTRSHAAAAFLTAPTKEAAILTADGVGEWATLSVGRGKRTPDEDARVELLREIRFPHSLGMLYSTFTAFLGFQVNEGEYKVMGLASYGKPALRRRGAQGHPARPTTARSSSTCASSSTTRRRSARTARQFVDLFGAPRAPWEPLDPTSDDGRALRRHRGERAARARGDPRRHRASACTRRRGCRTSASAAASRSTASCNARILRESGFERVFVPPAPGDAGCALGAALLADRVHFGNPDRDFPDHPYWGPEHRAGRARAHRARGRPHARRRWPSDAELFERIARELSRRQDRRLDGRADRVRPAGARQPEHPLGAAHRRAARPPEQEHQVPRGVPPLRARRADRAREHVLRPAPRRPPPRALHVGRLPGARGAPRPARRRHARRRHGARCRRSTATSRRASTRSSRPTGASRASRSSSTRRSTSPASRSSTAPSRGTPRSGAAGSTCSWRDGTWSPRSARERARHRRRRPGGRRMSLQRKGKIRRGLTVMGSAVPSIADFVGGMWKNEKRNRWLVPLVVFLCITGARARAREHGRGARAVHLHDLLRCSRRCSICSRAPRAAARCGARTSVSCARSAPRATPSATESPICACRPTRPPRRCASFYTVAPFPGYPAARQPRLAARARRPERVRAPARPGHPRRRARRRGRVRHGADVALPRDGRPRRHRRGPDARLALARGRRRAPLRRRQGPLRRDRPAPPRPARGRVRRRLLVGRPSPHARSARLVRRARTSRASGRASSYSASTTRGRASRTACAARSAASRASSGCRSIRSSATAPSEPARREAWLRDQYMHPEEHRHTTREVQRWFAESGIEYLRTYPDSLFASEPAGGRRALPAVGGRLGPRELDGAARVDEDARARGGALGDDREEGVRGSSQSCGRGWTPA